MDVNNKIFEANARAIRTFNSFEDEPNSGQNTFFRRINVGETTDKRVIVHLLRNKSETVVASSRIFVDIGSNELLSGRFLISIVISNFKTTITSEKRFQAKLLARRNTNFAKFQ